MLTIKISFEGGTLGYADYMFSEDCGEYYFYHLKTSEEVVVPRGSVILTQIYIDKEVDQTELLTEQYCLTENMVIRNTFCLCAFANIVKGTDFGLYDQSVIDALYFSDECKSKEPYLKCQSSYNVACLRFYGVSVETVSDKNVALDCNKMYTKFMFYTLLAEALMGKMAYIGSNLDGFHDCLEYLTIQNCTVNLINSDNLKKLFTEKHLGYLMADLRKYFTVNEV